MLNICYGTVFIDFSKHKLFREIQTSYADMKVEERVQLLSRWQTEYVINIALQMNDDIYYILFLASIHINAYKIDGHCNENAHVCFVCKVSVLYDFETYMSIKFM